MKNIMTYKGYWAEIKYSDEDECFCGEIEGLTKDSISFEGTTVKELKKDFKEAIDHYLSICKENNDKPDKQCKGKMKSIEKNISINELIKQAIISYLKTN